MSLLLSIYFSLSPSNPLNAKSGQSQHATKLQILFCEVLESYRLKVLPAEEIHKSILSVICIVLLIKRCHDRYDSTYNLPKVASLMMEERLGKGAKRTET